MSRKYSQKAGRSRPFRQVAEATSTVDAVERIKSLEKEATDAVAYAAWAEAVGFDVPEARARANAARYALRQAKKAERSRAWDARDQWAERQANKRARREMQEAEALFHAPVKTAEGWKSAEDALLERQVEAIVALVQRDLAKQQRQELDRLNKELARFFAANVQPVTAVVTRRPVVLDRGAISQSVALC